jgi:glycosyltransferase involved in cell wall biosynthesis
LRKLNHYRHNSLLVSWMGYHGRSATLAKELGAEAVFISAGRTGRISTALARYILQSVRTLWILYQKRPKTVIVMAPPLPLVALAWVESKLTSSRLIIDAHTGVFNDPKWAWTLRAFMWFARRSTATVVTNRQLVDRLEQAGVNAISLHDPPLPLPLESSRAVAASDEVAEKSVIVPCSFSSDEPIDAIIAAAKELPDVSFYITGTVSRNVSTNSANIPTNVRFTGYLQKEAYEDLLRSVGMVLALTTRELTMQRAGYEALAYHKPLLTSNTRVLREYFTKGTMFTSPHPENIRAGVVECLDNRDSLANEMAILHQQKLTGWDSELDKVRKLM